MNHRTLLRTALTRRRRGPTLCRRDEMKRGLLVAACLAIAVSALAADGEYHFSAYVFDAKEMYKPAGEGEGNPEVCKHLFVPPMSYDGRWIQVGTNATAFGVVAVTDGKTTKIIPLFKWTDEKGKRYYGCNGPTIWYARQEDSEGALITSILDAIKRK